MNSDEMSQAALAIVVCRKQRSRLSPGQRQLSVFMGPDSWVTDRAVSVSGGIVSVVDLPHISPLLDKAEILLVMLQVHFSLEQPVALSALGGI